MLINQCALVPSQSLLVVRIPIQVCHGQTRARLRKQTWGWFGHQHAIVGSENKMGVVWSSTCHGEKGVRFGWSGHQQAVVKKVSSSEQPRVGLSTWRCQASGRFRKQACWSGHQHTMVKKVSGSERGWSGSSTCHGQTSVRFRKKDKRSVRLRKQNWGWSVHQLGMVNQASVSEDNIGGYQLKKGTPD